MVDVIIDGHTVVLIIILVTMVTVQVPALALIGGTKTLIDYTNNMFCYYNEIFWVIIINPVECVVSRDGEPCAIIMLNRLKLHHSKCICRR